ncbi:hypothetical protein [Nodosilinea sp. E11]|uniref:hypothetical protein n=1 Tax=Nodosilinea sp. E11 TaxID=3037479 RepID=UPI002934C57E|nr:hypothetical protein [Nodosilinea sp. E11]WOD40284.1 hypothetical protein RRF56_05700 [Nodosilinea sp. E11]
MPRYPVTKPKMLPAIAGLWVLGLVVGSQLAVACQPSPPPAADGNGDIVTPSPEPQPLPVDGDQAEVDAVLTPAVRDRILQTVAAEVNRPAAALRIADAETTTWDGCMGVYVPDQMCTMIAIFGLRVVVTDGDQSWVYHTQQNGENVVQNPTASGSRNGLIVDLIPTLDPEPTPEGVVFRSVESGSLAGGQREVVLFSDGRLVHQTNDTVVAETRLSPEQVADFEQMLSQQRFPNLHRMRYITDAAFADYPTVRLSAGYLQTEYIDLALDDAPPALQAIVEAWSDLTQPLMN